MGYKDKRQAEVRSSYLITFGNGFSALKMDKGERKSTTIYSYKIMSFSINK